MNAANWWCIEHDNTPDRSWKPAIRARQLFQEEAEREAKRLNKIAVTKGVPWRYRAAEMSK